MSQPGLSIEQLLAALQRKGIPLPYEMGTFLVLEATEQVLALEATEQVPAFCVAAAGEIWLTDQGEVSVDATRTAPEQNACHALVLLLSDLLVRSAPGVPAMLLEIVEQGPSDGEWSLMRLRDDLEAALVPLNRAATRRVLARLLREVRRDADRGPSAPPSDARVLDRELDSLLGIEPGPDAGARLPARSRAPRARDEDATAEVDLDELVPHVAPSDEAEADADFREPLQKQARKPRAAVATALAPRVPSSSESPLRLRTLDDLERSASTAGGSGARIGLGLLLLAVALGAAYLLLGQKASRGVLGLAPQPDQDAAQQAAARPQPQTTRPRVGELRVTSSPARAQVFLLVGSGPAVVPQLPLGVAHEFVAMADGFAPSRAVVPKDAQWQQEAGSPRYELALQLADASSSRLREDLGPTRLPEQIGTPKGPLGSVRIITSPPGAKVYQLIGFTPDVRVENLKVSPPVELLVYLSGYGLQRISVGDADWKQEGAALVAAVDVTLASKRK